jgi:hypothetical protein
MNNLDVDVATATLESKPNLSVKWLITILIIAISILGLVRIADEKAHTMVDKSIVAAGASFAVARTLDAVISVVKSTELSVGVASIDVGEMLNPVSDLINKFTWVMTLAVGSLALQKILLMMMASKLANILLMLASFTLLITIWVRGAKQYRKIALSVFKVIVLIRFAVVLSLGLNIMVDKLFIDEQIQLQSSQIEGVTALVKGAQDGDAELDIKADQGFVDAMKTSWENATNKLKAETDKVAYMQQSIEDSIISFMELMALFLLKTILLPIGFLLMLKQLVFSKITL